MSDLPPGAPLRPANLRETVWLLWRRAIRRPVTDPICPRCAYPARGLPRPVCAECGADLRRVGVIDPQRLRGRLATLTLTVLVWWSLFWVYAFGPLHPLVVRHVWLHHAHAHDYLLLHPDSDAYDLEISVLSSAPIMGGEPPMLSADFNKRLKPTHLILTATPRRLEHPRWGRDRFPNPPQRSATFGFRLFTAWYTPNDPKDVTSYARTVNIETVRELFVQMETFAPSIDADDPRFREEAAELAAQLSAVSRFGDLGGFQWMKFDRGYWSSALSAVTPWCRSCYVWVWWGFWGLGCILIVLLALWLGRRSASTSAAAVHSLP